MLVILINVIITKYNVSYNLRFVKIVKYHFIIIHFSLQ